MPVLIGQLAALATSFVWSFTSILFTLSGREVGSRIVNRTRLLFAVVFVALAHLALYGKLLPLGAEPFRWNWLALSGLIGFVVGDGFLFQAFVVLGPRLSMLLMALAPVLSAVLGWLVLGETLAVQELFGIGLAVGGVALVVTDRANEGAQRPTGADRQYGLGLLFGLGAALGQALGLFASRQGLVGDFPALSGVLIRLLAATVVIWAFALARRQGQPTIETLREHPRALWAIIGGAFGGPFVGVWLSLIAVQRAPLGIASTLMSLSPVVLLPIGRFLYHESIGVRGVLGTLIAVAGTVLLFL